MNKVLLAAAGVIVLTVAIGFARILRGSDDVERLMAVQLLGTGGIAALLLIASATNVPGVEEFRKALKLYKTALLIQTRAPLTMAMDEFDKQQVLAYFETHAASGGKGGEADEASRNIGDVNDLLGLQRAIKRTIRTRAKG